MVTVNQINAWCAHCAISFGIVSIQDAISCPFCKTKHPRGFIQIEPLVYICSTCRSRIGILPGEAPQCHTCAQLAVPIT